MAGPWEKYQRGGGVMLPPAPKAQYEAPQAAATLGKTKAEIDAINNRNNISRREVSIKEQQLADNRRKEAEKRQKDLASKKTVIMDLANDILAVRRLKRDVGDSKVAPGFGEVGAAGNILRHVPGTAAKDVSRQLDTLKSSIARSALTNMRRESPTGGAVGALNEGERVMFEQSRGPIDQGVNYNDFARNLDNIEARTWAELQKVSPAAARKFRERFDGKGGGKTAPADDDNALIQKYLR